MRCDQGVDVMVTHASLCPSHTCDDLLWPCLPRSERPHPDIHTDTHLHFLTSISLQLDESGACVADSTQALEGIDLAFVHDLAVTENYYVLVHGSYKVWRE